MKLMTNISFPGLGIDAFSVNKVAFSVGPFSIRWYALCITLGIVLAFVYAGWRGKKNENVIFDDLIDIGLWTVILGVLGARLYYVLTTLDEIEYDGLLSVFAIWEGGLAIYGGIIGGCIGIVIGCVIKKIKWQKVFDMAGPGVMLAQAVGRWGNFFNGEAYGYPIGEQTRYYFFNTEHLLSSGEGTLFHALRMGVSHHDRPILVYYHPTFFYECAWNLIGFALINIFYKRKKFDGQIALMYFGWYGFGRMLIEGFRTDSLYLPGTSIRISQLLGLLCFVVSVVWIAVVYLLPVIRRKFFGVEEPSAAPVPAEGVSTDVVEETGLEEESESKEDIQEVENCEECEATQDGNVD